MYPKKQSADPLRVMEKINKLNRWILHDLNEHQMASRKVPFGMLLERHKKKSFLHRILWGKRGIVYYELLTVSTQFFQ